jgi:demethylmenaquinone methyltransferase/2-methoxy-6-polyprenyl-1,4-benzoquinol methylase
VNGHDARKSFFNERAAGWTERCFGGSENSSTGRFESRFRRLFDLLPLAPNRCVLDAGCGAGVLAPRILEKIEPGGFLVELDYAENMLFENRRAHADKTIGLVAGDVHHLPLKRESVHTAVCFCCFPHFPDPAAALGSLYAVLRPGGSLSIAHFDRPGDLNRMHRKAHPAVASDRLPGSAEMERLFAENGFSVRRFIEENGFYYIEGQRA